MVWDMHLAFWKCNSLKLNLTMNKITHVPAQLNAFACIIPAFFLLTFP